MKQHMNFQSIHIHYVEFARANMAFGHLEMGDMVFGQQGIRPPQTGNKTSTTLLRIYLGK